MSNTVSLFYILVSIGQLKAKFNGHSAISTPSKISSPKPNGLKGKYI